MKKLLIASLLTVSSAAIAEPSHESCKEWSTVATTVMTQRQAGTPLVNMMEAVEGMEHGQNIVRSMVVEAYSRVQYMTEEHQQRSINNFTNEAYMGCLNG